MAYFDMHCHLDFAPNAREAAGRIAAAGAGAFSATVDPRDYERAHRLLAPHAGIAVGAGLHPWWIADGQCAQEEVRLLVSLVEQVRFIGEVGLDFTPRHVDAREAQVQAFDAVAAACARVGGRVLSIHAVRSAGEVLDILQRSGAAEGNACILHWYSGSSDQLARAVAMGCYFSVGQRMLDTKRGRAYVKAIPADRLLLETDLPAQGEPYEVDACQRQMARALHAIEGLRGEELGAQVAETSRMLLGLAR